MKYDLYENKSMSQNDNHSKYMSWTNLKILSYKFSEELCWHYPGCLRLGILENIGLDLFFDQKHTLAKIGQHLNIGTLTMEKLTNLCTMWSTPKISIVDSCIGVWLLFGLKRDMYSKLQTLTSMWSWLLQFRSMSENIHLCLWQDPNLYSSKVTPSV